jgi:hypothetical protein
MENMQSTGGALVYETLRSYGVRCLFGMEDPIHIFHAVDPADTKIVTVRDEKPLFNPGYCPGAGSSPTAEEQKRQQ